MNAEEARKYGLITNVITSRDELLVMEARSKEAPLPPG
jgi:ATP-dependent protease ClpP protease subunit